jgi:hypothetical protein
VTPLILRRGSSLVCYASFPSFCIRCHHDISFVRLVAVSFFSQICILISSTAVTAQPYLLVSSAPSVLSLWYALWSAERASVRPQGGAGFPGVSAATWWLVGGPLPPVFLIRSFIFLSRATSWRGHWRGSSSSLLFVSCVARRRERCGQRRVGLSCRGATAYDAWPP